MSIDMDARAGAPGAPFGATDIEAESAATQSSWDEGVLMVITTTVGVLAASSLAVWVYLS
jgi:hypothetical protein